MVVDSAYKYGKRLPTINICYHTLVTFFEHLILRTSFVFSILVLRFWLHKFISTIILFRRSFVRPTMLSKSIFPLTVAYLHFSCIRAAPAPAPQLDSVGFPTETGETRCDGLVRPVWEDCKKILSDQINGDIRAGSVSGSLFQHGNCSIGVFACDDTVAQPFEFMAPATTIRAMAGVVGRECGDGVGGVFKQGQACVVVDTPTNNFEKRNLNNPYNEGFISAVGATTSKRDAKQDPESFSATKQLETYNTTGTSDLESRQDCPQLSYPCFTYTEQTFIAHSRGPAVKVCENVLPDGSSCTKTRSHTVSESVESNFGAELKLFEVLSLKGGFSIVSGTSNTESLATNIVVKCPSGQGYIVWYPLMEESRGECGKGDSGNCGTCYADPESYEKCSMKRPIMKGLGQLTGEYDVQCI